METGREGRWNGSVLREDCSFPRVLAWEMATEVSERLGGRQPGEERRWREGWRQITVQGRGLEELGGVFGALNCFLTSPTCRSPLPSPVGINLLEGSRPFVFI